MGCSITRAPPRDAEGRVQPHDHSQINSEDIMVRGIPEQWLILTDNGEHRISSAAFQPSSEAHGGGLSLGAKKVLECRGTSVDEWAAGRFVAVVCLEVAVLRNANLQVGWDPLDNDPAHCNAWGKFTRGFRKQLARELKKRMLDS